jgi:hypothetical protein
MLPSKVPLPSPNVDGYGVSIDRYIIYNGMDFKGFFIFL